jgi:hypothetical protein
MANTVTKRILFDAEKRAVIHVHLMSDGASGELTDEVLVDVSTLTPVPSKVTVEQIWWDQVGFDLKLEFDATTDTVLWKLGAGEGFQDFRSFGGVKDNSGAGSTGDIVGTTTGFAAAGDEGTMIIVVRKD